MIHKQTAAASSSIPKHKSGPRIRETSAISNQTIINSAITKSTYENSSLLPQACFHQENHALYGSCHGNDHIGGSLTSLPAIQHANPLQLVILSKEPKEEEHNI